MTQTKHTGFEKLAEETKLYPQEQLAEIGAKNKAPFVGIPKEGSLNETRMPLTPDAVGLLVRNGHQVWVETGAGDKSNFTDKEYSEAGAEVIENAKEIYNANIILKIEPPTIEEIELLKPKQILISALNLVYKDKSYFEKLLAKKVIAIAYEFIEDKAGGQPITRAMSEIAGISAVQIASEYLTTSHDGMGVILGGITGVPPTKLVILGAGTVAEYVARAAFGMGAEIKIFDNHHLFILTK